MLAPDDAHERSEPRPGRHEELDPPIVGTDGVPEREATREAPAHMDAIARHFAPQEVREGVGGLGVRDPPDVELEPPPLLGFRGNGEGALHGRRPRLVVVEPEGHILARLEPFLGERRDLVHADPEDRKGRREIGALEERRVVDKRSGHTLLHYKTTTAPDDPLAGIVRS